MATTRIDRTAARPASRGKDAGLGLYSARLGSLDGLRGLALVAVLIFHASPGVLQGGFLGVEMFFVLSGFLLISLLLDEHRRTSAIDKLAYAGRRLRRIAPALIVMLFVVALGARLLAPDDAHRLARDVGASLAGITNWHLIWEGSSYFAQIGRPPLVQHLWSIAVEVQAYLVLPLVAALVVRYRRAGPLVLCAGIAGSSLAMAVHFHASGPARAYYGTDARIGALLTGALLAVLLARSGDSSRASTRSNGRSAALALGALVALFVLVGDESPLLYPAGFLATQVATVVLIVAGIRDVSASRALSWAPLRWIGRRSYGIYLWHWPIVVLFRPGLDVDLHPALVATAGMAAAVVLGHLSYLVVERPFLLAERPPSRRRPANLQVASASAVAAALVVFVGVLALTAPTDPIQESLVAGERALAEWTPPATAEPEPQVIEPLPQAVPAAAAEQPVAAPAPAPAPAPPPPPPASVSANVKVAAVGDSVMLGAVDQLRGRLGPQAHIDASKSRQVTEGIAVIRALREQGAIGRVLIVHLGCNGPVKAEHVDAIVAEAGEAEHVLLVTVRVNKRWQDEVNSALRDGAARHAKAGIVDWHAVSQGHSGWFYSDGTHLSPAGRDAYANLLAGAVPPEPVPTPVPEPDPVGDQDPQPPPDPGQPSDPPPPGGSPTPEPTPDQGGLLDIFGPG